MANRKNFMSGVRASIADLIIDAKDLVFDIGELIDSYGYRGVYQKLRQSLYRLDRRGEIKRKSGDKYQLTKFGVVKLLPKIRRHLAKDKKVRILVFDIPETEKKRRDHFRRHIRMLGFKLHQKSVWVSYENCEQWLLPIIHYHKVGKYVSLYIGKHIW